MQNVIVVFPKQEDAMNIRKLLIQNGVSVIGVCTTGSQAIQYMDDMESGIVVCGYKFPDMLYSELHEYLPKNVEMLLVASQHILNECFEQDIVSVAMPIKIRDLMNTLDMMMTTLARKIKKQKERHRGVRSEKELKTINEAKEILMERNHMTEEEAHRYIQKSSMDTGTGFVETAAMIVTLYHN